MNKKEKKLLLVLLIVIILFLYYFFIFQKQLDNINKLNDELEIKESLIKSYETSKTSIKSLTSQKDKIVTDLEEKFKDYLSNIEQEEAILLINEILLRSNVEVTNLSFSDRLDKKLENIDFEALTVSVEVSGTYDEIINFMSSFWRFDHNIFVESATMSVEGDLIFSTVNIVFVRVNNEYASATPLFEWYNDVFYQKVDPFTQEDFSFIFQPNYFYTGTDVEFYNQPFESFLDLPGHWAEEVINFFGRNGYVTADEEGNVSPDAEMTRLETVLLLDLVFRWELGETFIALESFDDYDIISELNDLEKKALLKAYNSGYLFGYDDNTLKPYNAINYEELGYIGANLLGNQTTWLEVALEIQEKFGYTSPGIENSTLNASKAEIVYFLAYINEALANN